MSERVHTRMPRRVKRDKGMRMCVYVKIEGKFEKDIL